MCLSIDYLVTGIHPARPPQEFGVCGLDHDLGTYILLEKSMEKHLYIYIYILFTECSIKYFSAMSFDALYGR